MKITEKGLRNMVKEVLSEGRKSSAKSFRTIIPWDNSMGDYNDLVFKFIDSKGLQGEFEGFLRDYVEKNS